MKTIQFKSADENQRRFTKALEQNVRNYFKDNGLSSKGDYRMIIKTIVMLGLYIVPFILILTTDMSPWLALLLAIIMGFGEAGIGMAIVHDAAHGTLSRFNKLNQVMAGAMNILGNTVISWKVQHNILHHTYTNITDMDEDIDAPSFLLRFDPHSKKYKIQRLQFLYAWFFYGLMTLAKFFGEFAALTKYHKSGRLEQLKVNFRTEMIKLILIKTIYLAVIIGLPLIFTDLTWWQILIGFTAMNAIASLIMSTVFQMAHVIPGLEHPLPNAEGVITDERSVHQLKTTSNFGTKNNLLGWYIGGLNFQVEHHLFPNISHLYYPEIAPIVKRTAEEYNIPYHSRDNFLSALLDHARMLKTLGHHGIKKLKIVK